MAKGKLKVVNLPKEATFHPVKIEGEWLKVKWYIEPNSNSESKKTDVGWIKWMEDGKLFIELFYFA